MAVVVTSPQMENVCTEVWADPTEVATLLNSTLAEAEEATIEATYILWVLSGMKYHGYQCWSEDYELMSGQTKFIPLKSPVHEIISVSTLDTTSISGTATEILSWTWDGTYVHLSDTSTASPFYADVCGPCTGDSKLRVEYRISPFLAPGADRVVKRLASEFYKARTGAPCSLPERITSVTRQGVSWTILDPQDFLAMGRIGIGAIDQWLATVNRFGVVRSIDPWYMPTLVSSTQTGCDASCGTTSLDGGSPSTPLDSFDGGSPSSPGGSFDGGTP